MMQVKLCGLTQREQILKADQLGIPYLGMIFHPGSPRYVPTKLDSDEVRTYALQGKLTGVFVDEQIETTESAIQAWGLKVIQLHGSESPELCKHFHASLEVIKVISINMYTTSHTIQHEVDRYAGLVHKYLFDTQRGNTKGGTGMHFDWALLNQVRMAHPFMLSGGISYTDFRLLKSFSHPAWAGIDINSKFELEPGVKNMTLVQQFVQRVNATTW